MKENLKVLMLNGSPKANGNTAIALREMENVFKENGIEVENIVIGNQAVRGCIACGSCYEKGKCVFDDVVNEMATKFEAADDEAVLRMLWLWVGYVAYDETLSESGEEAVKRFLKRAWPKYHGNRITRSLLETWVQYAKDIKYERDAQAC